MLKVTARAPIARPAKNIDLPKWFYTFSENEFQRSSKSNLGMSFAKSAGGKRMFINKVAVAGHLLLNQYVEETSSPNFLKMVSSHSKLLLFHLFPVQITVIYELSIVPKSANSADLVCISSGIYPTWLENISRLTFTEVFLQKHQNEETAYFAKDILKKMV